MTRKEEKIDGERMVYYVVNNDINVSAIISELSSMGCKGDELGEACKTLTSENKGYFYENKETREKLLVIDERSLNMASSLPFAWMFFMTALCGGTPLANPFERFIRDLKKDGEEVR